MALQTAPDRDSGSDRNRIHRGDRRRAPELQSANVSTGELGANPSGFRYGGSAEPKVPIVGESRLSGCRSGFADGSGSRFWFRLSKNPPRGVSIGQ